MTERYKAVLLIGPPGSGKGTQGQVIGGLPGFYHSACGDVFRSLDPESELGKLSREYSSQGKLVPDDVTVDMWCNHMKNQIAAGKYSPEGDMLLLDGIPRSSNQADMMDEHVEIIGVLNLVCSNEEKIVQRLRDRALKQNRSDDADENVIRHRFEVYHAETAPVLAHYAKNIVADIDAMPLPAEVLRNVLDALIPMQKKLLG